MGVRHPVHTHTHAYRERETYAYAYAWHIHAHPQTHTHAYTHFLTRTQTHTHTGKEDEIKVTMKNIEKLQDRVAKLQEEKVFRQSEQARLFGVLEALWDRTRVPTEVLEQKEGVL